jgi:hypothetical protein
MAALTSINPTYMDLAKLLDPSGKVPMVVELLQETNEVLDDASFIEGNLLDGHQTTVRTGLPTPTWTKIYGFTQPTKSTTAQIIDRTGRMEMYSEIDVRLANLNGNNLTTRQSGSSAGVRTPSTASSPRDPLPASRWRTSVRRPRKTVPTA